MWESQWRHCKATSFLLLLLITCTFSPRKLNHRRLAAGVSRGGGGRDWGEKGVWGAKWQAGSFQSCHMTQDPVQMRRKRSSEWQLFHLECLANICLYRMQFFSCPGSSIPTLAQSVTATLDFGKKRVTFGTVSQRSVGGGGKGGGVKNFSHSLIKSSLILQEINRIVLLTYLLRITHTSPKDQMLHNWTCSHM